MRAKQTKDTDRDEANWDGSFDGMEAVFIDIKEVHISK